MLRYWKHRDNINLIKNNGVQKTMDPRMQTFEQICNTKRPEAADLCFDENAATDAVAHGEIRSEACFTPELESNINTSNQESCISKTLAKLLKEDNPATVERYFKVLEIIKNS